jgi:hypothetical protein
MRLSRHARNAMRLYGISQDDVESVIANATNRDRDDEATLASAARPGTVGLSLSSLLRTTWTS